MSHQKAEDLSINAELVGGQFDFYNDDTTKFLHLSGGFGGGKTTSLIYKLLKLSMLNRPYDGGLLCPSFTDYKRDVLPTLCEILDKENIPYKMHGTDHTFKFPWSNGVLRILTAEKKLRGGNLAYIGINELGLVSFERYIEAIARVRIKDAVNPQIVSSGTPDLGLASPYYEIFVDKPWENSAIYYIDTRENAHNLNSGYIDALYRSYPKELLDAFLKGQFVNISGNRFYFSYDSRVNDKVNEVDPYAQFYCAMDQNVDPFCSSIWQRKGNKFVGIEEIMLSGGAGFRIENMTAALKARGYNGSNTIVCPDPTAKNRSVNGAPVKEILEREGFQVMLRNVAPRFRERFINMNKHFEKGLIEINPHTMPGVKKDLISVEMDPSTFEKSKKNLNLTHFSDGLDYMVDLFAPFNDNRTRNSTSTIR